ncbi:L,D-transpeptidase [Candidatus Microgenomates bacterium]|nr:L,D-transpeptidase [Candidatus Microgenomates bacterium]
MSARKKFLNLNLPLLVLSLLASVGIVFSLNTKQNINFVNDYSGKYQLSKKVAYFDGQEISVPTEIKTKNTKVLGESNPSDKWIEVDLSEQKLRAWDGTNLFLESLVSTGLPYFPTPTGEFRIWAKLRYVRMNGGEGRYAYDLPNVPYTMFFENSETPRWKGYGLHGTYWHNSFGQVHSHGCVNLPTPVAEKLYYWVNPLLPGNKSSVILPDSNSGTRIVIHQ